MPGETQRILWPLIKARKAEAAAAVGSRLAFALLPMQVPMIAGVLIGHLSGEPITFYGLDPIAHLGMDPVVFAGALLLTLGAAAGVMAYWKNMATATLSRGIVSELRRRCIGAAAGYRHAPRESEYNLGDPVETQDRIIHDCAVVRRYVDRVFVQSVVNMVRMAYPSVMLFVLGMPLAVAAAAALVPQLLLSLFIMRRLHSATREQRRQRGELNRRVADLLGSAGHDHELEQQTLGEVDRLEVRQLAAKRWSALNMANVWFFTSTGVGLVWVLGAQAVQSGSMGIGELVAFVGMLAFVHQPMRQFTIIANTSRSGVVALERIAGVLCPPEPAENPVGLRLAAGASDDNRIAS